LILDTQWWLQEGAKPRHPGSNCPTGTEAEIGSALQNALASAGDRRVVVVGHHPVATHGEHGGFFDWKAHLFPLHEVWSWAWLPLPGVGSLYPLLRRHGITDQDLSSGKYEHMIRALESAFASRPPLVYASGHDHNLQVLEARSAKLLVVSGSGSISRPDPLSHGEDTRFASPFPGFMRLDLLRDGRARLEVFEVHPDGRVQSPFATWIE
jgi:hypothetical protein